MAVDIIPSDISHNSSSSIISIDRIANKTREPAHHVYWGVYLDGKQVSYTSNRELAEKTKIWMEKWLSNQN